MKRCRLLRVGICILVILSSVEVLLRLCFGLGAPVLSKADKDIDYFFKPNQNVKRFGNRISYNNYSMRMDYDLLTDRRNCSRRIIVCGDSVVNGGTLTDQKDVATSIVQTHYSTNELQVLNVSAGSWGPGNLAAFFRKFGCFDATDIIIEVDSHDLWEDDPAQSGGSIIDIDPAFPSERPTLAMCELLSRYFLPAVKRLLGFNIVNVKVDVARWGTEDDVESAKYNLERMRELYSLPIPRKALLIYRSKMETEKNVETYGERKFREQAEECGIPVYLLILDSGHDYRDAIHPNESGQRKMAELIEKIMVDLSNSQKM